MLFKAGETFLPLATTLRRPVQRAGLHRLQVGVNLFDIMTVVAQRA
jgi:hypothetical protein